jgi:hypothetical protein
LFSPNGAGHAHTALSIRRRSRSLFVDRRLSGVGYATAGTKLQVPCPVRLISGSVRCVEHRSFAGLLLLPPPLLLLRAAFRPLPAPMAIAEEHTEIGLINVKARVIKIIECARAQSESIGRRLTARQWPSA